MSATTVLHVIREIRCRTVTTQGRLAQATGYHPATISRMIKPLVASGLVQKLERRGREEPLRIHPELGVVIGVDTTGRELRIAVANLGYENIHVLQSEFPGWRRRDVPALRRAREWRRIGRVFDPDDDGYSQTLDEIADEVCRAVTEYAPTKRVLGVGLALPGPVTLAGDSSPLLYPTWDTALVSEQQAHTVREDLTARLRARISFQPADRPILVVANDASLGALGVFTYTRLDDFLNAADNLMYVCVTPMGVGAGFVLDGALRRGAYGFAGELGHLRVRPGVEGSLCPRCGGRGCLETLASERAVVDQLRSIIEIDDDYAIKEILAGSHPAIEVALGEAGWWLGVAIAHACMLLNPARVVLGGDLPEDDRFRSRVWYALERNLVAPMRARPGERKTSQDNMDEYLPAWRQVWNREDKDRITPELLGALAFAVAELGDEYLALPITRWYDKGGMMRDEPVR